MFFDFQHGASLLKELLSPIVGWSVRLGIGHSQISRLMKPLFFEAAEQELKKRGDKVTDSALSLLSGLHKGDVENFRQANLQKGGSPEGVNELNRVGVSSQVIARWLISDLPRVLPLKGASPNFTDLIKAISKPGNGISVRLILQDLERRGLVKRHANNVELLGSTATSTGQDAHVQFVGAVRDHARTCLANIQLPSGGHALEQSLIADGLHFQSVELIHSMARVWWMKAIREVGNEAILLSDVDEPQGGTHRLRFGVYFYSEDTQTLGQKN